VKNADDHRGAKQNDNGKIENENGVRGVMLFNAVIVFAIESAQKRTRPNAT